MLRYPVHCLSVASLLCVLAGSGFAGDAQRLRLTPLPAAEWETVPPRTVEALLAARVPTPPTIDGRRDDPAWQNAAAVTNFRTFINLPAGAAQWVEAQSVYDDRALYLGFRLAKPAGQLKALTTEIGGRVWQDDCLELFLKPKADGPVYQIDVNARGIFWAGADAEHTPWTPHPVVAATIGDKEWTCEISIPWADLGVNEPGKVPLGVNLRYLVGGGSGYAAWAADGTQGNANNLLVFNDQQNPGRRAFCRRFRFPTALPPGSNDQAMAVEVFNPDTHERSAIVRLISDEKAQIQAAQVIQKIPAGAALTIAIPVNVPTSGVPLASLMVCDPAGGGGWMGLKSRRIEVLPPLRVLMNRERFWVGETNISAVLEIGGEPALRPVALRADLWDSVHCLASVSLQPLSATRLSLSIDTTGLDAGVYRLRLRRETAGGQAQDEVVELKFEQAAALPKRRAIPLRVDWPAGWRLPGEAPVYAGVSFPGGTLMDEQQVRVVDETGREMPCQTETLARWSPGGSIQWLGLRFAATQARRYSAEFGSDVKRSALPGRALVVTQDDQAFTIDTGCARFELPKTGPLINRAWLADRLVIDNGSAGCLWLADQNGLRADETLGGAGEAPVIEVAGPLCVIVRREGLLKTTRNERLGKYVVRLEFFAGQPFVKIQHTLIQTEDSNQRQFSDIAFRVKPALSGNWTVTLDDAPTPDEHAYTTHIRADKGDEATLAQTEFPHHAQSNTCFEIGLRHGAKGNWTPAYTGTVAGTWASVSDPDGGVALVMPRLAQLFPKELEAGPDGLVAHLWSNRGGRLLDFRASTLADHYGTNWIAAQYPGGLPAFKALYSTAAGSARTHDLVLCLLGRAASAAPLSAAVAQWAEEPPLAIQDPAWLRKTEAMGPLHPYDPEHFPRIEGFLHGMFSQVVSDHHRFGDYGFLDYLGGPHHYDGRGQARFYRYYESEYSFRTALWVLYARSGDRAYHDYAVPFNRHLGDFQFSWWSAPGKPQGAMLTTGDDIDPLFWKSRASFFGCQGVRMNNFLYMTYLTGDRRCLDVVRLYADYLADTFDPLVLPNAVAGANHTPYQCLVDLYPALWDERLGRLLRLCRERMIDLDTFNGLANQTYYGAAYKYPIRVYVNLTDWMATGAESSRRVVERFLPLRLAYSPPDDPNYQSYDGEFMNWAWRMTGDPRYVSWIAERIGRVEYRWTDPQGHLLANPYTGGHNLTFLQTVPYALDVLSEAGERAAPWPLLKSDGDVYIVKPPDRSLHFTLKVEKDFDFRLVSLLNPQQAGWRGAYTGKLTLLAHPGYYATDVEAGLTPDMAELTLPKDVLPGEYVFKGVDAILASDADRMVLAMPKGAHLNAATTRTPCWYFMLPKGAKGSIFTSQPLHMDANGQTSTVPPNVWVAMEGGKDDALRRIRLSTRQAFVRFQGDIPPVLAQNDPTRFFIPQAGLSNNPLGLLEETNAVYVAGLTGRDGDQAMLVTGRRTLKIPRGEAVTSNGLFQLVNYKRGTLEFWFKPQWTASLLPADTRRSILMPGNWELTYGDRGFDFLGVAARRIYPYQHQVLHNPVLVDQGQWHHLALCWDHHPDQQNRWVSELYIDGAPSDLRQGRLSVGLTRCGAGDKQFPDLDVAIPRSPFELLADFNAVVDEIRISAVPRYPAPFPPLAAEPFRMDKDTLVLMHLNGTPDIETTKGTGPDGK